MNFKKAKEKLYNEVRHHNGTVCPLCERRLSLTRYTLTVGLIKALRAMPKDWEWAARLRRDIRQSFYILRWWGLIDRRQKMDASVPPRACSQYRRSDKGDRFLSDQERVHKVVEIINGEVVGRVGPKIGREGA